MMCARTGFVALQNRRWAALFASCTRAIFLLLVLHLPACVQAQYEKPAKEWCLAMRANQMVPVYPLSQDVRPGDVFLVQRSIPEQVREYKARGFLTLDDARTRLKLTPDDFNKEYARAYFDGSTSPHPYPQRNVPDTSIQPGGSPVSTTLTPTPAPRAAFPTYSFSVKRGEGLSLGVPISGIPVAMNFLNASEATGIVTLADASTYQAAHSDIMELLHEWVRNPNVADELRAACTYLGQDYVFLRVIKRVYMVGAIDVRLERKDRTQAGVQAGLATQASDPNISYETFSDNVSKQKELLGVLNELANAGKIGGALNVNVATERAVGLRESFDRPLVVGYLGMDVPYFRSGTLGAPIPTFEVLEGLQIEDPTPLELEDLGSASRLLTRASRDAGTVSASLRAMNDCGRASGIPKLAELGRKAARLEAEQDAAIRQQGAKALADRFVDEMNFQSTVGAGRNERTKQITRSLKQALKQAGLE